MALTEQQKYLLNRIPHRFALVEKTAPEPAEIVKARKAIEVFTERRAKETRDTEKKFEKAINNAREAVYFKQPEKALELIKAIEDNFTTR